MITIKRYESIYQQIWNELITTSKNATFLFYRSYMEYHCDRFKDHSLIIYKKEKPVALFPANEKDDIIYSHQGLTYGGLIYSKKILTVDVLQIFDEIINYYREKTVKTIVYKAIPYIYSNYPAQEDLYALFRHNAKQVACNISSTIFQEGKIKFIESRKSGKRKALKDNVTCSYSEDFAAFWHILNTNLESKYSVTPVHSLQEMQYLRSLFPENIKLYVSKKDTCILAGVIAYITTNAVHIQYISANEEGKSLGALDVLFDYLINEEFSNVEYFDFGQSTERQGTYLNENLLFQKEGFGGRGIVYNVYEIGL